jgi:co-chaperonin GroES (HSP10)
MKLTAIKNKLIIKLIEKDLETISSSGLVIVGVDVVQANKALVLAVGPQTQDVLVGQTILPNWNAAEETKFERETYYIISEDEVVGVFGESTD